MGKGRGKGYKNLTGRDPKVHSMSARGMKQPQRVPIIPKKTNYEKYESGDSTRISIEEPLYDKNGQRIDGEMGRILNLNNNVATVKLDDQRIVSVGVGLLTSKSVVYRSVKEEKENPEGSFEAVKLAKENTNKLKKEDLAFFSGSEGFYRYSPLFPKTLLTDGSKYVADKGQAYWLMDAISSWQTRKKVRQEEFQVWKLKRTKDNEALLTAEDGNGNKIARQKIPYTDFPLDEIKLYYVNDTILLPSEY